MKGDIASYYENKKTELRLELDELRQSIFPLMDEAETTGESISTELREDGEEKTSEEYTISRG